MVPLSVTGSGRPVLRLYVCGITPYDSGHLGHAFTFCAFDVLVRWVEAAGIEVRYVQNVTDVDDPLFARARRDGEDWAALADREQRSFESDLARLGWRRPDVMPRVSQEMPHILAAIDRLAAAGYAYQGDALYFPAGRYSGYGELSGRTRRSMIRKLREEGLLGRVGAGLKRDPLDFPLWRASEPGEPVWDSAHGPGRPGWHIECSAMALRHLGDQIDIHGGGRDLKFSHHESERAQSEALTGRAPFSRIWLHTGMVRHDGAKMSKSLGNLVLVSETLSRAPAAAVRLYLAMHRYRLDWTFRWQGLERAARLCRRLAVLLEVERGGGAGPQGPVPRQAGRRLVMEFGRALDDDLDTPRAVRVLRAAVGGGDAAAARWMAAILCGDAALT